MDRLALPESKGIPTVEEILGRLESPPAPQGQDLIRRAYEFAEHCHEGQKRKSGDPYFLHCSRVAWLAAGAANTNASGAIKAILRNIGMTVPCAPNPACGGRQYSMGPRADNCTMNTRNADPLSGDKLSGSHRKWQATWWPGSTSRSAGTSSLQRATT